MDGFPEEPAPTKARRRPSALSDAVSLFKLGIVVPNVLAALCGYWMARPVARIGVARIGVAGSWSWAGAASLALGSALTIGGACALNNCLDRDLDARMERTRDRPLAAGRLGPVPAALVAAAVAVAGILVLAASSPLAALLGMAGAFMYLVPYTLWLKRRSALSSVVGALAGSTPPLMGWAMATGGLSSLAWALFATIGLWQQAHVLALSLRRSEDYDRGGLPSPAAKLGSGGVRVALSLIAALLPLPLWLATGASRLVGLACALSSAWLILCWLPAAGGRSAWGHRMYLASLAWIAAFILASPLFQ